MTYGGNEDCFEGKELGEVQEQERRSGYGGKKKCLCATIIRNSLPELETYRG
jgi:hypothetical protein